jgi:hypothetical protein
VKCKLPGRNMKEVHSVTTRLGGHGEYIILPLFDENQMELSS